MGNCGTGDKHTYSEDDVILKLTKKSQITFQAYKMFVSAQVSLSLKTIGMNIFYLNIVKKQLAPNTLYSPTNPATT